MKTKSELPTIPIQTTVQIKRERIGYLLCCALEGGSNYWYMIEEFHKPDTFEFYSDHPINGGKPEIFKHIDYPLNPGGYLVFSAKGDDGPDTINGKKRWKFDLNVATRGLHLMAEKFPADFADFLNENEDANTGDIYLQLCLFGEIVYG